MIDRKFAVRAVCLVSSIAAITVAAGCGSPAPEEQTGSSSAALVDPCSSVPFTHQVCVKTPQGGGSSDTLRAANPLLKTDFAVSPIDDPTQVCSCQSLVGPPGLSRGNVHIGMSCYSSKNSPLQLAPPGPPGCTAGVVISRTLPDTNGAILANTWVCPPGTTVPPNLGAEETCDADPVATGTWASSSTGASRCEYVYWGTALRTDTDCFGDPLNDYVLVQERIFTTTQVDAGSNQGDGGCAALCCLPIGGGSGGGVIPDPVGGGSGKAAQ